MVRATPGGTSIVSYKIVELGFDPFFHASAIASIRFW